MKKRVTLYKRIKPQGGISYYKFRGHTILLNKEGSHSRCSFIKLRHLKALVKDRFLKRCRKTIEIPPHILNLEK